MSDGKTVQLFLMDGVSNGRIKCSLDNWIGKVYLIPRTLLPDCKDRDELKHSGIYLLLGNNEESDEEMLYVGQAGVRKNGNGVLGRVLEHLDEDRHSYFTHAIMIIDSEDSFGPTDIFYLENAFYHQAKDSGRVQVVNIIDPSQGNVTEERRASLDRFISNAKIVIGSLGYRAFDSVDNARDTENGFTEVNLNSVEPDLYLKSNGLSAKGRQTPDGFVVLKGSEIRRQMTHSVPEVTKKNREKYESRIGSDDKLTANTLFTSPSAAASFVTGSAISGMTSWVNTKGISLGELERAEAESSSPNRPTGSTKM